MIKKYVIYLVVLCFFVNFVACAGLSGLNPANLKGNHSRARFINVTYTMAFQDYQTYAKLENLKPEAVQLLKTKRKILANLHLPISLLNNHAESGIITDAMFHELLNKLLDLEMGWYTDASQMTTFALNPEIKDSHLKRAAVDAGLLCGTCPQVDPIFVGVLLELLKASIHAIKALLSQRNLDDEAMKAAWETSWAQFKILDPNALVVLE